jgi:hypothetical protein
MSGRTGSRLMPMPETGWRRHFDDPIPLPRGRQIVTLESAKSVLLVYFTASGTKPDRLLIDSSNIEPGAAEEMKVRISG